MWSHSSPFNNLSDETSSARQASDSPIRQRAILTAFIVSVASLAVVFFILINRYQASRLSSSNPTKTLEEKNTSQASPEILLGAPLPLTTQTIDFNQSQNRSSTQVKINGQTIPMPESGIIHREISNPSGQSSVDISSKSASNGSKNQSHSSVSVQIESKGRSDVQVMNSE